MSNSVSNSVSTSRTASGAAERELGQLARFWWFPTIVGVLMVLYSFAILSFSIRTVYAIAIGLGVGLVLSGMAQIGYSRIAPSWRWLILAAGVVDLVLGLAAFAWPGITFLVLVRLVGWVLLLRGLLDVLQSFEAKRLGQENWWVLTTIGTLTIVVAVWATRYPGRSLVLLVLWVGIALLTRGLIWIASGFLLRSHRAD